jgi:endonuclease/exonuclease/phosphatase family metal-dependent hydrolase
MTHARRMIAVAAAWALAACSTGSDAARPLRLVSWNIHHGAGLDDRVDVERIGRELAALAPDIVCLQEVDVGVARSGRIDIPVALARQLSLHAAFGKNIDHQGGDYGNAILSRWPVVWQHNLHYRMLRPDEQRGLLMVGVDCGGEVLAFGCTHIDYRPDDSERRLNAGEILSAVRERGLVAVAGDFNDLPGQPVHALLLAELDDCWQRVGDGGGATFPAAGPERRIDWVLVPRAGRLQPLAASVGATAASDHAPLVVDLVVGGRADATPPVR